MDKFDKMSDKDVLEVNAKLQILETVGELINSFRESYTRALVINDIKDPKKLETLVEKSEVTLGEC